MPKPPLAEPHATLESDLIATMRRGLESWRADLRYPESYSDMESLARQLMSEFAIVRKPQPTPMGEFVHEHESCPLPECQWCKRASKAP